MSRKFRGRWLHPEHRLLKGVLPLAVGGEVARAPLGLSWG